MGRPESLRYRLFERLRLGLPLAAATLVLWAVEPAWAETPAKAKPALRLPLAELGFPGYPLALVHAGASMATVHLVDATHALFTFSLRSLVPRLPDDPPEDADRLVAAELIDLPTGKVLARTEWHLHDHGRYLWSVGRGVFLQRSGDALHLFAPMQGLAQGDAFRPFELPHAPGHPAYMERSPDGKVLTVEVLLPSAQKQVDEPFTGAVIGSKHKDVAIDFYRLEVNQDVAEPIRMQGAGTVRSPELLHLPLDGDGYLWADNGERGRWTLDFHEFEGKPQSLTQVLSSCPPRMEMLSRSQFLVVSCRGAEDTLTMASYGFDGHENWEEPFNSELQPATVVSAPEAGRFALSRLVAFSGGSPTSGSGPTETTAQEIRIYGTESGDKLLQVQVTPPMRTPENFDFSPDGRTLAVLGSKTLDIYKLPELTERDRKQLAEAQTMTPPEAHGPIALRHISHRIEEEGPVDPAETTVPLPANVQPAAAGSTPAQGGGQMPGVAQPAAGIGKNAGETRRKPPTLLNPGETIGSQPADNSAPKQ